MKIATFNVNSVRRRLPIVLAWLQRHQPDVLCLQETKVQDADFPTRAFEEAGYHATIRGQKAYNGVATLTRKRPEEVIMGLSTGGGYDEDCRIVQVIVDGIRIVNTYAPQGYAVGSEKYVYKLAWFAMIHKFFETKLKTTGPVVWLGDLNVAPEPLDVYHAEKRINDPDFHIDARNAYKQARDWGFIDVFRQLHPGRVQYTYWDYFRDAYKHNYGWRIDHILVTAPLAAQCIAAEVDLQPREAEGASDHTIVWADFKV